MDQEPELVVNVWAILDAGTEVIYCVAGRIYAMRGTDAEKLAVLRTLSATDHLIAKRHPLPDRFCLITPDGRKRPRTTLVSALRDPNAQLFEELFQYLEQELPPRMELSAGVPRPVRLTLPADPLCVTTVLYEDGQGRVRPIITDADKAWLQAQRQSRSG